jgi:hypothetical protein
MALPAAAAAVVQDSAQQQGCISNEVLVLQRLAVVMAQLHFSI